MVAYRQRWKNNGQFRCGGYAGLHVLAEEALPLKRTGFPCEIVPKIETAVEPIAFRLMPFDGPV